MDWRGTLRSVFLQVFLRLGAKAASLPSATDGVQRILVLRPDHLGDVLLTTPALALLRQSFPQAWVTYLVGPWAADVASHIPDVDTVMTCPFPGMGRNAEPPWQSYLTLLQYRRVLRRERFDLAINLRDDYWWGAVLVYLSAIPRRLGYELNPGKPFLTLALALVKEDRHVALQNLALVRAAARAFGGQIYPARPDELKFTLSQEEQSWAIERLAREEVTPGTPVIILHPGTGAIIKLWTAARWATVADTLTRRYGARVILTGQPDEKALVEAISAAMHEPATIIAEPLNVGQLAALLKLAMLALGVDSGPLHLAVAMGTPSVHLFGPTDPQRFGPYGNPTRHRVIQTTALVLTCIPCGRLDYTLDQLPAHPCLRQIVPAQVVRVAGQALEGL